MAVLVDGGSWKRELAAADLHRRGDPDGALLPVLAAVSALPGVAEYVG
jgi:hypothetical protein